MYLWKKIDNIKLKDMMGSMNIDFYLKFYL